MSNEVGRVKCTSKSVFFDQRHPAVRAVALDAAWFFPCQPFGFCSHPDCSARSAHLCGAVHQTCLRSLTATM